MLWPRFAKNHHLVRSTLPQLSFRGPLRAILGGPLVSGFFDLLPKVFPIKKGSRNKRFFFPRVSNHEKSDGVRDFSVGQRELSTRDHTWAHFWTIFDEIFEKSIKYPPDRSQTQRKQILSIRNTSGSPCELPFLI